MQQVIFSSSIYGSNIVVLMTRITASLLILNRQGNKHVMYLLLSVTRNLSCQEARI